MEKQNQTLSQSNANKSWTSTEIGEFTKEFAKICIGQNAYGTESQFALKVEYWLSKIQRHGYTINQVLHALEVYTDRNDGIPTPSDIINILSPVKPKITQTEYITAKENWAREGYKSHCYYLGVMREFEAQEGEQRNESQPITDEKVLSLGNNSIKRIN